MRVSVCVRERDKDLMPAETVVEARSDPPCACASMCGKWIVCPAFGVLGVCMGLVMGFRV